jgi:hypothetical protein
MEIPIEIVNKIIMMSRPTYNYMDELKKTMYEMEYKCVKMGYYSDVLGSCISSLYYLRRFRKKENKF